MLRPTRQRRNPPSWLFITADHDPPRELFRDAFDAAVVDEIRAATNCGFVPGAARFQWEIAAVLGRRVTPGQAGGHRARTPSCRSLRRRKLDVAEILVPKVGNCVDAALNSLRQHLRGYYDSLRPLVVIPSHPHKTGAIAGVVHRVQCSVAVIQRRRNSDRAGMRYRPP